MTHINGGYDVKISSTEFNNALTCENALKVEKTILASMFSDISGSYTLQCIQK
jgi:hypothetical protein